MILAQGKSNVAADMIADLCEMCGRELGYPCPACNPAVAFEGEEEEAEEGEKEEEEEVISVASTDKDEDEGNMHTTFTEKDEEDGKDEGVAKGIGKDKVSGAGVIKGIDKGKFSGKGKVKGKDGLGKGSGKEKGQADMNEIKATLQSLSQEGQILDCGVSGTTMSIVE